MKRTLLTFCFALFIVFAGSDSFAQLSKKEKKEWKKKQKQMDPEDFKSLLDENGSLKGQLSSLSSQVQSLQSKLSDKDSKISELQNEVSKAEAQMVAQRKKFEEDTSLDVAPKTRVAKGVVFKVQIGAFRNKDLSKYLENSEFLEGESDNGTKKYTLGTFTDYWEADTFKKYLRGMGVKDAWIVPFKDGVRVPIKDVLEGIVK
jgi:DNA repair exonuclease SbcCD ATPase subunit